MTQSAASHRVLIFVVGRFHGWNCILGGDRDVFRDFRVLPLPPFLLHLDTSTNLFRYVNRWENHGKSTNQSICQSICEDGQSVWILGQAMFSKLADRPTEALLKGCCFPRSGRVSMSHPNLIPSMPCWVCLAVSLFFTAWRNLCFPYLFRKKVSICKRYSLEISRDFPT